MFSRKAKKTPRTRIRHPPGNLNLGFTISRQVFNILPENTFCSRTVNTLSLVPCSIKARSDYIDSWKLSIPPTKFSKSFPPSKFCSPNTERILKEICSRIEKIRSRLRCFLHRWRTSRLKQINTEDVITLEEPRIPVIVVDWTTNSTYVFEASSLMKDITYRLMHHTDFFEVPQPPRNPLTNTPFTLTQLISIYSQLDGKTKATTAYTAFRDSRWDINRFALINYVPLQLNAFRKTMLNTDNYYYRERLLDFIHLAYEEEGIDCYKSAYKYMLYYQPKYPLLLRWAKLCTSYHEAEILYRRNPTYLSSFQDDILEKTIPLLHKQGELRECAYTYIRVTNIQFLTL